MKNRRTALVGWAVSTLLMVTGGPTGLVAVSAAETGEGAGEPNRAQGGEAAGGQASASIRFAFKDARLDDVIDFFAREAGLPVIREVEAPDAKITFISASAYTLDDALRVLNTILQTRGVLLRRDSEFLYLRRLEDMKAAPVPTYTDGVVPADVTDEQIVSVLRALTNATAAQIAEQLSPLVAKYGAIVALPQQNAVIVTETAAQARRILSLIGRLDEKPAFEESVRLFALTHIRAEDALASLKVLVAERQRTVVIDERGNRRTIEEDALTGVRMEADQRTNSIIALGASGRLDTIDALIDLLDVPERDGGVEREMATFRIETMAPSQAERIARAMYAANLRDKQPTFVAMDPAGKLAVIGDAEEIRRVDRLLSELEGRAVGEDRDADVVLVAAVEHMRADQAVQFSRSLQTERERRILRLVASPDGRAVVIRGEAEAANEAKSLIARLDTERNIGREVRILRLDSTTTRKLVESTVELFRSSAAPQMVGQFELKWNDGDETVAVLGERAGLDQFSRLLDEARRAQAPQRTARILDVRNRDVDELIGEIETILAALAKEQEYAAHSAEVRSIPETNSLLVIAPNAVHELMRGIVQRVDRPVSRDLPPLRAIRVEAGNVDSVAGVLRNRYESRSDAEKRERPVLIQADAALGMIFLSGTEEIYQDAVDFVASLNRESRITESPTVRTIRLQHARAEEIAPTVERLLRAERLSEWMRYNLMLRDQRLEEDPDIRVATDRRTNSVVVTGPKSLLAVAEEVVSQLDMPPEDQAVTDRRITRIIPLINAQAPRVAETVQSVLSDQADGLERPALVRVDAPTNSIVLRGTPSQIDEATGVIQELDQAVLAGARELRTLRIDRSRADAGEMARTLSRILQEQRGLKVEVIDASDLLDRGNRPRKDESPAATESSVPADRAPRQQSHDREATPEQSEEASVRLLIPKRLRVILNYTSTVIATVQDREDPDITIAVDPDSNTLILMGSSGVTERVMELARMLERELPLAPGRVRIVRLPAGADAAGISNIVNQAVRQIGTASDANPGGFSGRVAVIPDTRVGALIVSANDTDFPILGSLIGTLSELPSDTETTNVAVIPLESASAGRVSQIIERVLIGSDRQRRAQISIAAEDTTGSLIVRAPKEIIDEIRAVVRELDRPAIAEQPITPIKLERADAEAVAASLQRFFDDRARAATRPGQRAPARQVAVVGDRRTSTVLVSAPEADIEQVRSLVEVFDAPAEAKDLRFRVIALEHTRVGDILETVRNLAGELQWMSSPWFQQQRGRESERIMIQADTRSNSIIVLGEGESFETIESIVRTLDAPAPQSTSITVRVFRIERAELDVVRRAAEQAFTDINQARRWWEPQDPNALRFEIDQNNRALIAIGQEADMASVSDLVERLDEVGAETGGLQVETALLTHADAARAAGSVQRFFNDRAQLAGIRRSPVSVVGSRDGNALIITAPEDDMKIALDIVSQIDRPDLSTDVSVEVFALSHGDAREVARAVTQLFPRRGRAGAPVTAVADVRTNAVIVTSPQSDFPQVEALIRRIDTPSAGEVVRIRTFALQSARATEVATTLRAALDISTQASGRARALQGEVRRFVDKDGEPVEVRATITPEARSNTLLVTASEASMGLIADLIAELDEQPAVSPVEYRVIALENASAYDVTWSLRELLNRRRWEANEQPPSLTYSERDNTLIISATGDQFAEIDKIIRQLDTPAKQERRTDFVSLEFADAEQVQRALSVFYGRFATAAETPGALAVSIVADPASNSLVVSAAESEWPGIRELIAKLDSQEYDSSRQLEVIALQHADAVSLARALQDTFDAPLRERLAQAEQDRARRAGAGRRESDEPVAPTVLVDNREMVSVAAEPLTNSIIISAARRDLERIREMVARLDVPEFAKAGTPRIIPISGSVRPSELAASLTRLYEPMEAGRSRGGIGASRGIRIIGDDNAQVLLVRADDGEFEQIRELTVALLDEGGKSQVSVRVLALSRQSAVRMADTVRSAFTTSAQRRNEPLVVTPERRSNSLVIASSGPVFEEIQSVVKSMDGGGRDDASDRAPAATELGYGQQLLVVSLKNLSPGQARGALEGLGVTRAVREDSAGLVSEPVTLLEISTKNAIGVLALPEDLPTIETLLRLIDAEGDMAEQSIVLVRLKSSRAEDVVRTLRSVLVSVDREGQSPLARSLAEQVRRLNLHGETASSPNLEVDLTVPIRVEAVPPSNAVLVASTKPNVAAIRDFARLLDSMPQGDAITLRIFHLESASATRIRPLLEQLFAQGDRLRTDRVTGVRGRPATETGRALSGEVAITVDERTNALIVAGHEESVALAELLIAKLDGEQASGWVETRLIPLQHADATKLTGTIRRVLIDGIERTPEADALRRQVGRLRVLRERADAGPEMLESQVFAPMTALTVVPEESLNAVIVLGSASNVGVVQELIRMLDVEGASRFDQVRIYPLEHASADRVASLLRNLFREQVRAEALRPEDEVIIEPDVRSNTLVIATSPRSFAVIEGLLKSLDRRDVQSTIGLHVVPVGNNSAAALAPRIEQVMRERLRAMEVAGGVSRDVVSVRADEATNSLIVAASEENLVLIKELVAVLGGAEATRVAGDGEAVEIFTLQSARATEMISLLEELYVREVNRTRGQGTLRVRADERLNAIVATGSSSDIRRIQELIRRLDGGTTGALSEIKIIPLRSANALEMVNLLRNVLAGQSLGGARGTSRQSLLLRFVRERTAAELAETGEAEPTETEVSAAIREQVTLTPDLRTNSVIVTAPAPMMLMIETMINELDSSALGARDIRVFSLENADAENMAELLRDLFNLRQQGNLYVLVPTSSPGLTEEQQALGDKLGLGDMTLTVVPDERQALSITIDARTNSLLVSGTPRYLDLVASVVERLDTQTGTEREQFAHELKNARVEEVADALQRFIDQEQDRLERALGPDRSGSVLRRLEREISVVGVPGSSRLIVSASPRYKDKIQSLIQELDTAPPQVLIQVLLAEVTLDSERTWGIDLTINPFGGRQYSGVYQAAGSGVLTAIGVPNFSVSSLDFELLVRALEVQGRLEVLSRPQILVNDNERALIEVGEEIQLVTNVERLDTGRVVSDVTPRSVGVILNVTPSVSSDGFVRLDIAPEISSVTTRTTQISEDFEAPIISQRRADTTVTVKDGQTIVIGGLIQNRLDSRRSKVPLLGDIPLVGEIFKSERTSATKTELLIILTPRVILTDQHLYDDKVRQILFDETERLSLPPEVRQGLRDDTVDSISIDEEFKWNEREMREREKRMNRRNQQQRAPE